MWRNCRPQDCSTVWCTQLQGQKDSDILFTQLLCARTLICSEPGYERRCARWLIVTGPIKERGPSRLLNEQLDAGMESCSTDCCICSAMFSDCDRLELPDACLPNNPGAAMAMVSLPWKINAFLSIQSRVRNIVMIVCHIHFHLLSTKVLSSWNLSSMTACRCWGMLFIFRLAHAGMKCSVRCRVAYSPVQWLTTLSRRVRAEGQSHNRCRMVSLVATHRDVC